MRQRIEVRDAHPENAAQVMKDLLTGLGAGSNDFRVEATGPDHIEVILEGNRWDQQAVDEAMTGIRGEGYKAQFLGIAP